MSIQLVDIFPIYPDKDDEKFQTQISAKKEFNELTVGRREPTPQRGKGFTHQIMFERFMRTYDDCLLIHETGTGKTCAVTRVSEWLKKMYITEKSNIKR